MASITQTTPFGSPPSKIQDGPYQIELEDIESEETNTTNTTAEVVKTHSTHATHPSTSPLKPENQFVSGYTTGETSGDAATPSRTSTYLVRACVCAFAILLLWITSLNLAKIFVLAIVRSPSTQDVVNKWDALAAETSFQKDTYTQCASDKVYACNHTLYTQTSIMLSQITANQAANNVILQTAGLVAQSCSSLTVELSTSIKNWKNLHPFNDIMYNQSCSAAEIKQVAGWVDRPDLIQNQAYVLAQAYSQNADSRTARMLGYAQNYTDYNEQYLANKLGLTGQIIGNMGNLVPSFTDQFGNITMGLLGPANRMINCLSMATAAAQACPNGARAAWDSQSAAVQQNYQTVKDKLSATISLYSSTTASMQSSLRAVKSFFDAFLAPAASSLSSIGISLGGFPSTTFTVPTPPSLGNNLPWADPSFTSVNVTQHIAAFANALGQSAQRQRQEAGAWWSNQSAVVTPFNGMFNDYNPPPLIPPMEAENTDQQQESADYRTNTAYALNEPAPSENTNSTVALVKGFLASQAKSVSVANFDFEPLGGNLLLAPLLNVIPNLYVLALAIDYIWRGYRSVRLIIKYWFQSAVGLPVIDVRDYENHAAVSGPVKAVSIMTNPCTIFGVLILLFTLALISIIPPYTSIVNAYEHGCIATSSGTVLSNNTFSIAYNYASSDGNGVLTDGYGQYDASRNEICGRYLQSSTDTSDADLTSLTSSRQTQTNNAYQTDTIFRCVNFTIFGNVSAWNTSYYGSRHPMTIVLDALDLKNASDTSHPCMPLAMSGFSLLPAIFNCSNLPPCQAVCSVSAPQMFAFSLAAGCETEYLVHSFIARFGITLLVFICFNLSRMLFMAAIVRLGWRSLTPRGFEFVSNCTRVGETSKTINQQLVVQLNKAIANYERFAIFLFGIAILIHIPYIVVLSTVNASLEYKS